MRSGVAFGVMFWPSPALAAPPPKNAGELGGMPPPPAFSTGAWLK